ncbi:hypothetical protein QRD02_14010, partial [Aequorivita sp. SDUM287046]
NAFTIDAASGELKVLNKVLFDFETNPTITGTISVANGLAVKNALVTISLNDLVEENIFNGNVILSTQAEVDEFGTHDYTGITGYLIIGYNLGPDYSNIEDISPLQALTFVGGEIIISYNERLQNLIGLHNLVEIGTSLNVYENPVLSTLESLSSLTVINRNLGIIGNASLANLTGLHNITSVEGDLTVQSLRVSNLEGLDSIIFAGSLNVSFNSSLQNIDALSALTEMSGYIVIQKNPLLNNLDALQNINSNISQLRILENDLLTNLNGLRNIGASVYLEVSQNPALITLSGLESVTNINQQIVITDNDNLTNLNGLNNLIEVGQQMRIWQNSNLSDFCALTDLCVSGNLSSFSAENNAYNPTKQDIIDGNCSL